jgi:pimeloyl-ACP methyl ester carboxylesterase
VTTLTRSFLTIDGGRIEYEWHGPSPIAGRTIVFLHEGLGAITRWRDFPAALCARTACSGLVYNRPGYGASDLAKAPLTPHFMHDEALRLLPKVLDAFGIEHPILFGHSDGASIALIYAGATLKQPAGLILEAPHVFVEDEIVRRIAKVRERYRSSDLRARLERHHGAKVDVLFESWTSMWMSDEFRAWNIAHILPQISCPALVVKGIDDEYGTLRQVDAVASGLAGSVETLVLEHCRHSPHIDQRQEVEVAVASFIDRLPVAR